MVAAWSGTPEARGIELLWKRARCFAADGDSGPSLPANNPTADALFAVELLRNRAADPAGYMIRDIELRTMMRLPGKFNKLTPME